MKKRCSRGLTLCKQTSAQGVFSGEVYDPNLRQELLFVALYAEILVQKLARSDPGEWMIKVSSQDELDSNQGPKCIIMISQTRKTIRFNVYSHLHTNLFTPLIWSSF